jgi:arylsulfatase A-like enzyme
MIRRIGDAVADIVQLLKDLGIDENTLVVFTSDNGTVTEHLGEFISSNICSACSSLLALKNRSRVGSGQKGLIPLIYCLKITNFPILIIF